MYKVQKKDGSLEDFDRNKIVNGVVKSGASEEEAEAIAAQIEGWLPGVAVEGAVKAMEVRSKVLELLRLANPTAADAFEGYQKAPAA